MTSKSDIRPWGSWHILEEGNGYKVKCIQIKPKHKLSLQYHNHRCENWIVVAGVGIITLGDESFNAQAGNYFFIPKKTPHRAENTGGDTFKIIEVQIGDYLEEDDIVRLQDEYGRT